MKNNSKVEMQICGLILIIFLWIFPVFGKCDSLSDTFSLISSTLNTNILYLIYGGMGFFAIIGLTLIILLIKHRSSRNQTAESFVTTLENDTAPLPSPAKTNDESIILTSIGQTVLVAMIILGILLLFSTSL